MKRNTLTSINQLRFGDRFRNPKNVDVWEVVTVTDKVVTVNQPGLGGVFMHLHHEMRKGTTEVIFLRHTKPLPGEECLVQDLQVGDVFHKTDDIITEYTLTKPDFKIKYWHRYAIAANGEEITLDDNDVVCFVRKAEEVKV